MSAHRTLSGGRIDRDATIRFTFDGTVYKGFAGDTLASALLASGITLFGRSFKYHRPRGVLTAGPGEPNALVTIIRGKAREPNIPATQVEIFDGLVAESQNRFPSLTLDFGAINQLGGPLLAAGFYYKTFMGPMVGSIKATRFWHVFEWFIRRAAGLGRANHYRAGNRYGRMNAFCDVLVVGGGEAGLRAALEAASKRRVHVILCETDPVLGGHAKWSGDDVDGKDAGAWAEDAAAKLADLDNVTVLTRTSVWGYYDGNTLAALERVTDHKSRPSKGEPRHRYWTIRANEVVLATGALERPLVFPGNDRPGVMLASAAARYAREYATLPGDDIVVFTNNDGAYRDAERLAKAGGKIRAIVDVRLTISAAANALAKETGAELLTGYAVTSTSGRNRLTGLRVQPFDTATQTLSGNERTIKADCLAVSGGWSPAIHLASQAGQQPVWDDALQCFLPPEATQNWVATDAVAGDLAFGDGLEAAPAPVLEIPARGKAFVDFQHDVTSEDVRLAHREGFHSVEHLKRYTTLGMATDQGKTSNVPGLAIMAAERGLSIPEVGTTRFRPPFSPVSIGSLAAERFHEVNPERLTPMHDWHEEQGAIMMPAGLWWRPQIYGQAGETIEQAYVREARKVRADVGIIDVSTLGKIAVQGPDAADFLDRVYTNMFSTLKVGKARYGLMLREDGFAMDDGTTWRLGEHDFLMTTTTANAGKVMQHLEYFLDVVWPDMKVILTSVTDEWAGAAIGGPKSRDVLAACVTGTKVDNETLPFMGIVHGEIDSVPVMICRLSFSGERAYEVYCGAGYGQHVWDALMEAGKPFGIVPYGMEALGTLRIEKGHVTGAEIDGRTTGCDLHLDWMLSKKKPFVGSAMMNREGLTDPGRLQLVGVVALDGRPLGGGAHITPEANMGEEGETLGHITAVCYSPALEKYIGLALVKAGKNRLGTRAHVCDVVRGRFGPVDIVSHHFFDPDGSRMHG